MKNSLKKQPSLAKSRAWTKFLIRGVEASLTNLTQRDCISPSEKYNLDVALVTIRRITNNWALAKELQLLEKSYDKETV